MTTHWKVFKNHPVAVIFYLIYLGIFSLSTRTETEYHKIIKANGGKWPYGVREWDGLLLFFFGFIFAFIIFIFGLAKSDNKFYWWLLLLIITPLIIFGNIYS